MAAAETGPGSTAPHPSVGREVMAGLNVFTIALPMTSAAGVIAYGPLGAGAAALGAVAGLVTAAVGGLVVSLARSDSGLVMTASSSAASVQASGLAIAVAALADRPALIPAVLPLLALATGLFQVGLGVVGAGRLVKFVPFPVVSGFVSGIGLLLILKFSRALVGTVSLPALWTGERVVTLPDPILAAFTGALLAFAFVAQRKLPRGWPVALITCAVGIAAFHALRAIGRGGALGGTLDAGAVWTILGGAGAVSRLAADAATLALDPDVMAAVGLGGATVALVSLLETVFATRAAQTVSEFPSAPRRDMIGLGLGSAVTAASGAVAMSGAASQTMLNYQEGGRTRLSTVVPSGLLLLILLGAPGVLGFVPLCIFPPLIMFVGWRLIDPYTGAVLRGAATRARGPARSQARRDALVHLSVLCPTALTLPLLGVATGVVLSCCIFIASMSRPVVRRVRDGHTVTSKRMHTRADSEALAAMGEAKVVMDLEGTLFFANSEDLATAIKDRHGARFVILNLRGITDIDATGARILEQTRRTLAGAGVTLMVAETPPAIAPAVLRLFPPEHAFPDLDDAMEAVEQALLLEIAPPHRGPAEPGGSGRPLGAFDLCDGASPAGLARLSTLLEEERHPAGTVLCHEGEPAGCIWLIRSGAISVRLRRDGADRRIVGFGPGTTVGEMAVIENKPRSATLVADEDVDLYVLHLAAYRHILTEDPELAAVLFRNLARVLSDRLRARSVELRAAAS